MMKKNKLLYLILIVPLVVTFFRLLHFSYTGANDLPFIFNSQLKDSFNFPYTWITKYNDAFGVYNVSILWAWSYDLLFGLFSLFGVSYGVLIKIFGIFPAIALGLYGMWRLLEHFEIKPLNRIPALLFFVMNSYFLELVDGGQIQIALAYSLFPLIYLYTSNVLKKSSFISKLRVSGLWLLLSIFDIRFVYIAGMLISIWFAIYLIYNIKAWKGLLVNFIQFFGCVGLLMLLFHSYWILPALLVSKELLPATYGRVSQLDFLSFATLGHAFFAQQPHWYKNIFGNISAPIWYFSVIPVIALFSIFYKSKKVIVFWLVLLLIGILLVKGVNPPFEQLYSLLFQYIPGFSLYRDPTKFFVFITFGLSVLLAFSFEVVWQNVSRKIYSYSLTVAFVALLLLIVSPVWLGKMTGIFSRPFMQNEYLELAQILERDTQFSRVLWLPVKPPIGYSNAIHPSIEGQTIIQKRPFTAAIRGDYDLFNFIREASYSGELLEVANVGYIASVPLNPLRDDMKFENVETFNKVQNQLRALPWIAQEVYQPIQLLKLTAPAGEIFSPKNEIVVFGSDDIYGESTKSADAKLRNNGYIFAEEYPGFMNRYPELLKIARFNNQNKTVVDIMASFIPEQQYIFPAKELDFEPNKIGWWKREASDFIRWRKFLQEKYGIDNKDFDLGGGWAMGEGNVSLPLSNNAIKSGQILMARIMESSRSGSVSFKQNNVSIGSIGTMNQETQFRWYKVGNLIADKILTIETEGDINVVNALAVIDQNQFEILNRKTEESLINSASNNESNQQLMEFSFNKVNPTHYKIKVTKVDHPSTLVFSQSFDPLWKLNNQSPFPVYSIFNGYVIDQPGEYDLYYEPQKYIIPGLIITLITVIGLGFVYLRGFKKK